MKSTLLLVFSALAASAVHGLLHGDHRDSPLDPRALHLNEIETLVFTRGDKTVQGGRTRPVPQLICKQGPGCGTQYEPASVVCENIGRGLLANDPNWKCTAELVNGLRLGVTDVVCEGFRSKDDRWVLRGSCALEYTLLGKLPATTYTTQHHKQPHQHQPHTSASSSFWNWLFFAAVLWVLVKWWLSAPAAVVTPRVRTSPSQPVKVTTTTSGGDSVDAAFWKGVGIGSVGGFAAGKQSGNASNSNNNNTAEYRRQPPAPPTVEAETVHSSTAYGTTKRRGGTDTTRGSAPTYAEVIQDDGNATTTSTAYGKTKRREEDVDDATTMTATTSTAYGKTKRREEDDYAHVDDVDATTETKTSTAYGTTKRRS